MPCLNASPLRGRTCPSVPLGSSMAMPVGTSAGLVSGPIEQLVTTETRYAIVPVVGLDADIAVGQHVAVVPLLRALAASDGLNLRSGVAARVRW